MKALSPDARTRILLTAVAKSNNGNGHSQPADKQTRRQRVRQSVRNFFILLAGGDSQ